jgi:CheY-like chemotaxis protein
MGEGRMKNILIVDNSPGIEGVASSIRERGSFHVTVALSVEGAIKACLATRYDLILLDMDMSRAEGIGLISHLREKMKDYLTPIIVLTADSQNGYRRDALEKGASRYLAKPFEAEVLMEAIEGIIGYMAHFRD